VPNKNVDINKCYMLNRAAVRQENINRKIKLIIGFQTCCSQKAILL